MARNIDGLREREAPDCYALGMSANDDASWKRAAAVAALREIPDSGTIGLGTGSTTRFFLEALAEQVRLGRRYVGVPTSEGTRVLATELGIPLLDEVGPWEIDVTVDGADEVSDALDLLKGGGGAHTREKIVALASKKRVIVVDETKLSPRLGERREVPVEVLPFGHAQTSKALEAFGRATLRAVRGAPFRTDGGNFVVDVATGPIADPGALDARLHLVAGVVETGLFVGRADLVIVGAKSGVSVRSRAARS
jgi:ribose 5-phosphate isomerase A